MDYHPPRSDSREASYKAVKSIPNSHTNIEHEFCTRSPKIAKSEHLIACFLSTSKKIEFKIL